MSSCPTETILKFSFVADKTCFLVILFYYFSTSILYFGLIRCPRLHSSENGVFFKVNTVFYNTRLTTSWQRWSHLTMKSFHTLQLGQYYASCQAAVMFLCDSLGVMRSFVPPSPTGQWYAELLIWLTGAPSLITLFMRSLEGQSFCGNVWMVWFSPHLLIIVPTGTSRHMDNAFCPFPNSNICFTLAQISQ